MDTYFNAIEKEVSFESHTVGSLGQNRPKNMKIISTRDLISIAMR